MVGLQRKKSVSPEGFTRALREFPIIPIESNITLSKLGNNWGICLAYSGDSERGINGFDYFGSLETIPPMPIKNLLDTSDSKLVPGYVRINLSLGHFGKPRETNKEGFERFISKEGFLDYLTNKGYSISSSNLLLKLEGFYEPDFYEGKSRCEDSLGYNQGIAEWRAVRTYLDSNDIPTLLSDEEALKLKNWFDNLSQEVGCLKVV